MDKLEALELINKNNLESIKGYVYMADHEHNTSAMVILGDYYYAKGDYSYAIKYFQEAGDYKDNRGYNRLGSMYFYGKGVEKDYHLAYKYFTKSYLNQDKYAAIKLADMYINGYFVNKDPSYALEYLDPLYNYYMGEHIKGNYKDNLLYEVLIRYSHCYESGLGIKKDLEEALKCLVIAYDGFSKQMKYSNKSYNLLKYTLNEIDRLKKIVKVDPYEILNLALDTTNTFSYVLDNDTLTFIFSLNNKEVITSLANLCSVVTDKIEIKFNKVNDFNKIDYEQMRPIDYQVKNNLFRLYDTESTLMHFTFESFESNIFAKSNYYDLIDLLKKGNVLVSFEDNSEIITSNENGVSYLGRNYKSIDDFILNSPLKENPKEIKKLSNI